MELIEAEKPPKIPSGIMMVNLISSFLGDCAQTNMPSFAIDSMSDSPSSKDSSEESSKLNEEETP